MHLAEIAGTGRTSCREHWSLGLLDLAVQAAGDALADAADVPTAIVTGNALGGALGDQRNLACHLAERLALSGVETYTVEADDASGGAAFRLGLALLGAGMHERVLVVGAEKSSDALPDQIEAVRAAGLDAQREAGFGIGPTVGGALTMTRYLAEHGVDRALFYHISATAHAHAARNPLAFFPWELGFEQYDRAPIVAEPMTVCDNAPQCDGAAACLITQPTGNDSAIRVLGSSAVSVPPGIAKVAIDLELPAAGLSARNALEQAGVGLDQMNLFELHDSSSIIGALSLESIGLAARGMALELARNGSLALDGVHPTWTFGGHKARGLAAGAAGVFQIVEATLQLAGAAGDNQLPGARLGLTQCLGSFGATAVTHVLGG